MATPSIRETDMTLETEPLADGKSVADIVREYFPDADDRTIDHIMWTHTGWPSFWGVGRDGDTPEACLRTQLAREADRNRRGMTGCWLCGSEVPLRTKESDCPHCRGDLTQAGEVIRSRREAEKAET